MYGIIRGMKGKGGLYRSSDDVVFGGVCAGLAKRFGWNVHTLRNVLMLTLPFFFAFTMPAYAVLWVILKPRPTRDAPPKDMFWFLP